MKLILEHALDEISASQWGMVTTAQAEKVGVSRLELSRLASRGRMERIAQGVYKYAGVPGAMTDALKAVWLSTEPGYLAEERLSGAGISVVVSGESAAMLHGVGDLRAERHEFTVSVRRQTQRSDVRYRVRAVEHRDLTIVDGLPVTSVERTVADLVETRTDLSLVGGVVRDAVTKYSLDRGRLQDLLAPLASRNGVAAGDGAALLDRLLEIAGLGLEQLTTRLARVPGIADVLTAAYVNVELAEHRPGNDEMALPLVTVDPELPQIVRLAERAREIRSDAEMGVQ